MARLLSTATLSTLVAALALLLGGCASSEPVASDLDEAVNVGYGSTPRSEVTGAVSTLKPDEARRSSARGLEDLLVGSIAGVDVRRGPGGRLRITIRGTSSFYGSNEPLYVLDGVTLSGGLPSLNPNDIASIEVLKDAGASAIYGSRGANGVVLIKTKRSRDR